MLNITPPETLANLSERPRTSSVERERMEKWLEDRVAASKRQPSAEVVTLTPVLAELLLGRNSINRPIAPTNQAAIVSDVANGRWQFNGQSVIVSKSGKLLDGQHRCESVLKSGTPIQTVIVFGPDEEARYTIDIGRPKSAPNFLFMKGHKNVNTLASAARLTLLYRRNNSLVTGGSYASGDKYVPTKTEVVEAVGQLRGLGESVDFVLSAPKVLGSRSVLAFAHYAICKKSGRIDADNFFGKVISGDNLRRGDPILYCRNRLPDLSSGTNPNGAAELIFKCWNAHRRGEVITKMPLNGRLPKVER